MLKGSADALKYTYTGRTQLLKLFQKNPFTKIREATFKTMTSRKPQKVLPSQIKNGTAEIPLIIPLGGSSCSVKGQFRSYSVALDIQLLHDKFYMTLLTIMNP